MLKYCLLLVLFNISPLSFSQEISFKEVPSDLKAKEGTYQIIINNTKDTNKEVSEDQLLKISENRDSQTDVRIEIEGLEFLIMSKEKMYSGIKWSKYLIIQ